MMLPHQIRTAIAEN